MIPILYAASETSFTSGGICRLTDCGVCQVTEERNGVFECMFTYPIGGAHYGDITEGRIIYCTHDETGIGQPFDIYARDEPIDGVVTFYAHHISYRLGRVILQPMTAGSCSAALSAIPSHTYNTCPFTFWTDKTTTGNFKNVAPKPVKEALGGSSGSILDVYGKGEYEWDRFTVKLHLNRGTNTGVTIRYGVNMTGYDRDLSYINAYNACVPYWLNSETNEMVTPGVVYATGYDASNAEPVTMDLSTEFDSAPTQQQLADKATARMNSNQSWLPTDNITVSFVPLWQTEEYASVAPLQRLRLCDRVNVIYGPGKVQIQGVQIIRTVYDVLLDRYDSMELGTARSTFEAMLKADITEAVFENVPTKTFLQQAIEAATDALVRGGYGSYVVFNTDVNGNPNEILIMDNPDVTRAVNVWRWNSGGLGFSRNGYNGPYTTAITYDGKIVADFISTGTLNAGIIKAGVLSDQTSNNSWDLASGALTMKSGSIDIGNGNFKVTNAGTMSCKGATITGALTSYSAGNINKVTIADAIISGNQQQTIEFRGGIDYNDSITISALELDIPDIESLYIKNNNTNPPSMGMGWTGTVHIIDGTGTTENIFEFSHGICTGFRWILI